MRDFLFSLLTSVAVAIIPSLFSTLHQYKIHNNEILKEQYQQFVAPIYYLMMSSYSIEYIISEINRICEEKPYLMPDSFLENFSDFKLDCKDKSSKNYIEFQKKIQNLYKLLRYNLHYSKEKLNSDEKKNVQKYFGKHPTFWGAYIISVKMGVITFVSILPIYILYSYNYINITTYYALSIFLAVIMLFLDIRAMNRYYDGK